MQELHYNYNSFQTQYKGGANKYQCSELCPVVPVNEHISLYVHAHTHAASNNGSQPTNTWLLSRSTVRFYEQK